MRRIDALKLKRGDQVWETFPDAAPLSLKVLRVQASDPCDVSLFVDDGGTGWISGGSLWRYCTSRRAALRGFGKCGRDPEPCDKRKLGAQHLPILLSREDD